MLVLKLDRLGRNLRHLVNTVHDLTTREVGFQVLTGHGRRSTLSVAAKKGASLAGRKGPATWLRYELYLPMPGTELPIDPREIPYAVAVRQL